MQSIVQPRTADYKGWFDAMRRQWIRTGDKSAVFDARLVAELYLQDDHVRQMELRDMLAMIQRPAKTVVEII